MKKTYLMAFALMGLTVFSSCDKDDEKTSENKLLGTWTVTEADLDIEVNDMPLLDYLVDYLDLSEEEAVIYAAAFESIYSDFATDGLKITFNSNNTYTGEMPGEAPQNGTYSLSADGKTLTLDGGTEDESQVSIISLTSTTLEVKQEEEGEEDFDEDGEDESLKIKVEMTLTK